MRLAQIEGETVANVIHVNPADVPDWAAAYPVAPDGIGPGARYVEGSFIPIPDPTPEEEYAAACASVRAARDLRLAELDALVTNPLRWAAFSAEEQAALARCRQALLDVPDQAGFPGEVIWPVFPV